MANESNNRLTLPAQRTEPQPQPQATKPQRPDDVDEIAYIPQEGDPIRIVWNGITFPAHMPVKVPRSKTVLYPKREAREMPDGSVITRSIESRIPMVELAKMNPFFSVNGETPIARKIGKAKTPTNPDEYRGYAIRWITTSSNPGEMDARWDAEQPLREQCGCDDKDIAYLRPFFEAKHEQVAA